MRSSIREGLSNHLVIRAREFGRIDGFGYRRNNQSRTVTIIYHRTLAICRELNGKVIPVGHLRDRREKILKAKTPEAAKKISGWLSDSEVESHVKGKTMEAILSGSKTKVIGSPPYHWHCRTVLVGE